MKILRYKQFGKINESFDNVVFMPWYKDQVSPEFLKKQFGVNRGEIEDLLTPIVDLYDNFKISIGFRSGKSWDSNAIVSTERELNPNDPKYVEIDILPFENSLNKDNAEEVGMDIVEDLKNIFSSLRGYKINECRCKKGFNPAMNDDILCWIILEKE